MSNTDIWDKVQKTDPKYTKQFNRGGGFKGTATNATYLARKATETFGPAGKGWGVIVIGEEIIEGAPHFGADGLVVAHDKIHKVHARLWYVLDGVRGEVEQFGQTQIVGKNKNGYYTDEEAPKKSLTDAMTKCLSLLGFASDIHLGLYDDNKYVNQLRDEFEAADNPPISEDQAATVREYLESTGSDVNAFLKWLKAESVESIPQADYGRAIAALKKKANST